MPSKSRSQQRLMAAAEHGASFPMAQKLRASMSTQQLHDFASGSMKGKPEHTQRTLHPALKQHAAAIKQAHAHLSQHVSGFRSLKPQDQFRATQAHVRQMKRGR